MLALSNNICVPYNILCDFHSKTFDESPKFYNLLYILDFSILKVENS
jgi:hypothetical protein